MKSPPDSSAEQQRPKLRGMFSRRREPAERQDITLQLGCGTDETGSVRVMSAYEEDNALYSELEGGLFGGASCRAVTQQQQERTSVARRFLLAAGGGKQVERTSSYESGYATDSDQYLWSSDGDALAPDTLTK
jgi:hypothetical protein